MMNLDRVVSSVLIAVAWIAIFWFVVCAPTKGDDLTELRLAQCLRAEADGYTPDYAPIAHILKKRALARRVTLGQMTLMYCSIFDKRSPKHYRSMKILASTFAHPRHGTVAEWRKLRRFVDLFLAGKVPDPCPAAIHWGGVDDVPRPNQVEVCKWLGKRGNKFYRVRRRGCSK